MSSQLDAMLAARAHREGRALRTASLRHRRLVDEPLVIVLWQLGAEPFTVAAAGYGTAPDDLHVGVAGEPRNRDLAFRLLLELARWFNPRFERHAEVREELPATRSGRPRTRARSAPQVVVANRTTIDFLGRLGRRLAYLPLDGEFAAPPELVRFGRHLLLLHRQSGRPGQQLVVAMTELLQTHWATSLSSFESMSLAALDAFIEPPHGVHGFHAAATAELRSVGPNPTGDDDERLMPLVEELNARRGRSTEPATVTPLLEPIARHYEPLVSGTWDLVWRCRRRELRWPEAPSVDRRWTADRDAYTRHIDWMATGGRYRTRQTFRQAAMTRDEMEDDQQRLDTEEACDDPLRMIPFLLDNKAALGTVSAIDTEHRETPNVRRVRRPLVTLSSPDRCLLPKGKKLYWTEHPGGTAWTVHDVARRADGGTDVVLKKQSDRLDPLPVLGDEACFSILTLPSHFGGGYAHNPPWTHAGLRDDEPASIESDEEVA